MFSLVNYIIKMGTKVFILGFDHFCGNKIVVKFVNN